MEQFLHTRYQKKNRNKSALPSNIRRDIQHVMHNTSKNQSEQEKLGHSVTINNVSLYQFVITGTSASYIHLRAPYTNHNDIVSLL